MGSNFIHYVLDNFPESAVINLDLLTYAGNEENLRGVPPSRYRFVKGDICDTELVKKLMRESDFVVNFAAESHVDRSIHSDADDFVHTNVVGVHSLLKALRGSPNVKKMVHISTDEVWGDLHFKSQEKFTEESPLRPSSPYAASKAAGEMLVRAYHKTYGLPVVISRSVNNFGPRQHPEKVIPFFAMLAMDNKPLPIHGSGLNVRSWIHVDDHTRAVLALLEKAPSGEIYGVSADEECSNMDIAGKILRILNKRENLVTFVEDRPANDRRYAVNPSKLLALGWRPQRSLDSHIPVTIDWYKENQTWLSSVARKYESTSEEMRRSSADIRKRALAGSPARSLSIFFPCLNEKGTIATMVLEGRKTAVSLTDDFEIIVVDDGSTDGSRELLLELQKSVPELKLVFREKRGYGAALRNGFKAATKELVFYTDGDGQYDVSELPMLWNKLTNEVDIVNGYKIKRADPLYRIIIGFIYQHVTRWAFWLPIRDPDCDFRLIRRKVFDTVELKSDTGTITIEIVKRIQQAGFRFVEVGVSHYNRTYGSSQFFNFRRIVVTLWRLAFLWVELIIFSGRRKNHG